MTKLAVVLALLVPVATGCSKSKTEKACQHMVDLARAELDKQIDQVGDGAMKKMLVEMKEKAESQTDSDLATCAKKMDEHDIDAGCILDADTLDDAQGCLFKR